MGGSLEMKGFVAGLVAVGLFVSSAQAATFTKIVAVGGNLKVAIYYAVNVDCSLRGYPTVRVTNSPQHGLSRPIRAKTFQNFQ